MRETPLDPATLVRISRLGSGSPTLLLLLLQFLMGRNRCGDKEFSCIPVSTATKETLDSVRHQYNDPTDIFLSFPHEDFNAYLPTLKQLPIHVSVFSCGLRLPLHPTFHHALQFALMQLTPGFWCNLVGLLVIWRESSESKLGIEELGHKELRYLFQISL
ncbi:hypothetical protein Q3G72_005600 [Acer saccharum]|nr:hypothetical protein Q3G72_005600 [Acer saccharum]